MDEVADNLWLGRFYPEGPRQVAAATRHSTDRAAARRALLAIREPGLGGRRGVAISLSHTEGVGAALVGPARFWLGVDVVRIDRVRPRHAWAVLDSTEWGALHCEPGIRPALGWALKEAAAKAAGDPASLFPSGLQLTADGDAVGVRVRGSSGLTLAGGWDTREGFLFAWVFGERRPRGPQPGRCPRGPGVEPRST